MFNTQYVLNLAKKNNGIVTTRMIDTVNIHRETLAYLVKRGNLEKAARGVYILPDTFEDGFFNIQNRFKKGIFSLDTALFFWNLTDRTPVQYHMTFPNTYNCSAPKQEQIICHSVKNTIYKLGVTQIKTPYGNLVNAYNAERTLCDILRVHNHTDIQVVSQAFKEYAKSEKKNIPLLSDYAKILHVQRKLRSYLEVLL